MANLNTSVHRSALLVERWTLPSRRRCMDKMSQSGTQLSRSERANADAGSCRASDNAMKRSRLSAPGRCAGSMNSGNPGIQVGQGPP